MKKKKIILIAVIVMAVLVTGGIAAVNSVFHMIFMSQIGDLGSDVKVSAGNKPVITVEVPLEELKALEARGGTKAPETQGGTKVPGTGEKVKARDIKDKAIGKTDGSGKSTSSGLQQERGGVPRDKPEADKAVEKPAQTATITVTAEKVSEMEKKVSLADKARVTAIISSKLSADDMAVVNSLLNGNISGAKINQLKQVLRVKLSNKEKQEIKQIFYKYLAMAEEQSN